VYTCYTFIPVNNLNNTRQEIIYTLMEMISKSHTISKKTMRFGTDSLLHPSEIHMVVSIADSHEPHVIGLAKELGITKGAVSQIVKKLDRKGIVKRNIDINNRSKYLLEIKQKSQQELEFLLLEI